jgi:hypothetical protein
VCSGSAVELEFCSGSVAVELRCVLWCDLTAGWSKKAIPRAVEIAVRVPAPPRSGRWSSRRAENQNEIDNRKG